MGSLVAHEMYHSFDDGGSEFDYDGNLVDWWDPTTKTEFQERVQCLIDQYGNYTDPQTNLTVILKFFIVFKLRLKPEQPEPDMSQF